MTVSKQKLLKACSDNDIEISGQQTEMFCCLADLLTEYNSRINLTAVTDEEGIITKHFVDSIVPLRYMDLPEKSRLIDVGTGAGFPGIPMLIMRPDLIMTMLDGTGKKITAVEFFLKELCLKADAVHGRAEELSRTSKYRDSFDVCVSRAVAAMPALCEYCLPFVKQGGCFYALKGPDADDEIAQASGIISRLGASADLITRYSIAEDCSRTLIKINKNTSTPPVYPRSSAKIKSQR